MYHQPPFNKEAETGDGIAMRMPIVFSNTQCQNDNPGYIGADNDYVYGQILKMAPKEIAKLINEGVLV